MWTNATQCQNVVRMLLRVAHLLFGNKSFTKKIIPVEVQPLFPIPIQLQLLFPVPIELWPLFPTQAIIEDNKISRHTIFLLHNIPYFLP